ncbi:MAG: DUF3800 domain-containing protein [Gammaproteobacteria bacterium]
MFFLYADESGSPSRPSQKHFIFAGVTVFERQAHWLSRDLEKIASSFGKHTSASMELHGSPMWGGKSAWRKVPKDERINTIKNALRLIDGKDYRIIASVVNKEAIAPEDPVRFTFHQVISRFDHFLVRQFTHYKNPQRGLLVCDKSNMENSIQTMATEFKTKGHLQRKLRNMAEVPVFVDSKATRLIQLADLVAYALFRKYERDDNTLYEVIKDKFDSFGGVRHGLHVQI